MAFQPQPSTSKQDLDDDLAFFLQELECEENAKKAREERTRNLSRYVLKEKYYRVYLRVAEINTNAKCYKYHQLEDAVQIRTEGQYVRILGVYRYEPQNGMHYLYTHLVNTVDLENPLRIPLDVGGIQLCPIVDAYIELLGVVEFQPALTIRVHYFKEICYCCFEQYFQQFQTVSTLNK